MPTPPPPPVPNPLHPPLGRHRRNFARRPPPTHNPPPQTPPTPPPLDSVSDVRLWLQSQGFSQYADAFTSNEVNGSVLKTLTSEELRDDLGVINLRHRRHLLDAIANLQQQSHPKKEPLPEHGRILDHLSNVRTYHSWIRVGVQLLGFSIVTLRLSPDFRPKSLISAASFYFAVTGIIALLYGIYRYRTVIHMIERSTVTTPKYKPDRAGVLSILILLLMASTLSLTIISLRL